MPKPLSYQDLDGEAVSPVSGEKGCGVPLAAWGTPAPAAPRPAAEPSSGPAECSHCGLSIPRHRRAPAESFCCEGCRRVHDLIRGAGLARYYEIRRGVSAPPPEARDETYAWAERLLESARTNAPLGPTRLRLALQGIHCSACLWLLQELYRRAPGALDLRINSARGEAELLFDPARFDLPSYLREANRFGYRFGSPSAERIPGSRGLLVRLGVCVALTMNLMILSLSYYFGLAPGDGALYELFGHLSLALGTFVFAVGGSLFLARAWNGLRARLVSLDLPIAAGIVLVYAASLHAHFARGPEHAYFDSLAAFVTLMVLGRWLQERLLERNRLAVPGDGAIDGMTTRRFDGKRIELAPTSAIEENDELWIAPGELVPVECLLFGDAPLPFALDWINGEPAPRDFEPGAPIPAGAIHSGVTTARVRALEPFARSRVLSLLRPEPESSLRTLHFGPWRRAGAIYVAAVGALALAAFLVWLPQGFARAAAVATSVLVVTCPCAIGLATPLAGDLALGRLRRRGIFVRREGFFERATRVRKILFDKTGTLTWGRLELDVPSRAALSGLDPGDRDALWTMCVRSNHPMSRCLASELERLGARLLEEGPVPVREVTGRGLEWTRGGATLRLDRGEFTRDGRLLARLSFEETVRPDAIEEVRELGRLGYEVHLVSGDGPDRALRAASLLGIDAARARFGLSPSEKADYIRSVDRSDTLMIGDGLNDAPGFEASLCAATPAVDRPSLPARADFFFLGEGVAAVRLALLGARRLAAVTRGNLAVSLAYNAAALALCFSGVMTPVLAAILMPASSIGVVALTTLRLRREDPAWK